MTQFTGAHPNPHEANGHKGQVKPPTVNKLRRFTPGFQSKKLKTFDKSVVLRQSPLWPRAVAMTLMAATSITVLWACLAKVEEAVPAQGKLEPSGVVQPVQAPVSGVVEQILVEEGESVEAGDLLITFNKAETQAQLESRRQIRTKLMQENAFYRTQLEGNEDNAASAALLIPPELFQLTSNRSALAADIQLYQAMLKGELAAENLSPAQQQRFRTSLAELNSRLSISALEVEQLQKQLTQTRQQLSNARKNLQVNVDILNRLRPLVERGGFSEIQFLSQEQEVSNRQTEVNTLLEEEERLLVAISQAEEQFSNTALISKEELLERISANKNEIASIDSQLTKIILENEKQIQQLDGELSQIQQTLTYQELRAPVSGTIFNLKANQPGYVVYNTGASEPILEIVPEDKLVARVFITNQDIGFVKTDMRVDVRIDSFSYSEFGDIEGTLVHIGSDALPPDETFPFYRFPAEIELDTQYLPSGEILLSLQSGMSVSANIKIRKRRVITLLSNLFIRKVDSLKSGR
ncbi:MAG: HlyD family efflux transporter periplasmic adaptor subunit [Leptolyngbyaceae cyanobacterium MO_188.B28]|nr:HlyD family efflux transporter periplasmic adaptor subunit [Leptolyngbyaceae cyanobacterium MO_188.B28]